MADSNNPKRRINFTLIGILLVIVAVAVGLAVVRPWNQEAPTASIELKFVTEALPNSSMKVLTLAMPRAGTLTVKIFSKLGDPFNAYLVRFSPLRPSQKGGERPLIPAFTAERVHKYDRSARVEAGEYHLTLVNSAPVGGMHEPSLTIYCRLDP